MPLNRRTFLAWAFAGVGVAPARAHTPYGQWVVYRQKHLLVGAHRGDARTYELAKAVVAALAKELPEAAARVARGPRPQRLASLLSTGQLMTAVLPDGEATAMAAAAPPFERYEPAPLTRLAELGEGYSLYAHSELSEDHAWLVTQALAHAALGRPPDKTGLPAHPGAAAYWRGEPTPQPVDSLQ